MSPPVSHPAPTLTVVIPTLDEAAHLPTLLARLTDPGLPAADRADEVLVADGGSRDGTRAAARRAGARVVEVVEVVETERGRGAQLAAGAAAASGELLLFLHADCVPDPGALAALRGALTGPGPCAAVLGQRVAARGWRYRLVERAAAARARRGAVYGDSGLCARRGAYEAVGGYRPLALFEDLDLSRRLHRAGGLCLVEAATVAVSPRRWQREGFLRCTLRNWMLRMLYELGVGPGRLARLYPREPPALYPREPPPAHPPPPPPPP